MKIDLDELRAEVAQLRKELAISEAFIALVEEKSGEGGGKPKAKPRAGAVCKACGQQPGYCDCQPERNSSSNGHVHKRSGQAVSRREMGIKAGELMRSLIKTRKMAEPFDFMKLQAMALAAEPTLSVALDDKSVGNFLNRAQTEGLVTIAGREGHKKIYRYAGVSVPRDTEVALAR